MRDKIRIGIVICDRYHTCTGGECMRSLRNREGAFSMHTQLGTRESPEWEDLIRPTLADEETRLAYD